MIYCAYMNTTFRILKSNPYSIAWMLLGWIAFAALLTVLTTFPLIDDYIPRSIGMFLRWDTWQSFLVYVYNGLPGGLVNYLNTFLFGVWLWLTEIYRLTILESDTSGKRHIERKGFIGSLIATLGGGCTACGFTFLTNIFGGVLGGVLSGLPLAGAEIGILGSVLILVSILRTYKQINTFVPGTCTTL